MLLYLINIQQLIKNFDWSRACHVQGNICNVTLASNDVIYLIAAVLHALVLLNTTKPSFQCWAPEHSETYKRYSENSD